MLFKSEKTRPILGLACALGWSLAYPFIKLGYGELQRQCLDIDDQGRLLLNTPAGVKAVASGEVTKVDL